MYNGLLFTGDMHLRADAPKCRTDDFLKAQWRKFSQIQQYANLNKLWWIDAGDIFHKAIPKKLEFVNTVLHNMPGTIHAAVIGNHDMPSHNENRVNESACGTLFAARKIRHYLRAEPERIVIGEKNYPVDIYGASYGGKIPAPYDDKIFKVLVLHDMVYKSRGDIIPNNPGSTARKLLKNNPGYDIIVSGHNHQSFYVELNGRYLINVGCMTRQAADQENHKPRVAEWRPKYGIKWFDLDCEPGVVSREHIDRQEKKEEELNAFVESLQNVKDVSLSFEENVEHVLNETHPEKPVVEKVREAME